MVGIVRCGGETEECFMGCRRLEALEWRIKVHTGIGGSAPRSIHVDEALDASEHLGIIQHDGVIGPSHSLRRQSILDPMYLNFKLSTARVGMDKGLGAEPWTTPHQNLHIP